MKKLSDQELDKVTGGKNNGASALKCPRCSALICTTIEQIIQSKTLICPHCGLRLNIDQK